MSKKGITTGMWVLIVIGIVSAVSVGAWQAGLLAAQPEEEAPKLKGEFAGIGLPDEISGSELALGNITIISDEDHNPDTTNPTKNKKWGLVNASAWAWLNTTHTPVVNGSETVVLYNTSDSTNYTLVKGIVGGTSDFNYSVVSYKDGQFNVTNGTHYNHSTDKLYIDYRFTRQFTDTFIETDDDFNSYFVTEEELLDSPVIYNLGYKFELDGDAKELDITGEDETSNLSLKYVCLLEDKEGVSMDCSDSLVDGTIDGSEFEITKDTIKEGEYVVLLEVKAINDITNSTKVFDDIDMSITGGDRDTGRIDIWVNGSTS